MSRIGKLPIKIPSKVQVNFDDKTKLFEVTGPLGALKCNIHPSIQLEISSEEILVKIKDEKDKLVRSLWGTTRAILNNLILGVTEGFDKSLELSGVGFKMELKDKLILYLGFSHVVEVEIPAIIKIQVNKNVLSGTSIDKQAIGDFFTTIHNLKPCDPYKQKGFKFPGRFYQQKIGKKGK
jgi:large subunit ribosomal protein L6